MGSQRRHPIKKIIISDYGSSGILIMRVNAC